MFTENSSSKALPVAEQDHLQKPMFVPFPFISIQVFSHAPSPVSAPKDNWCLDDFEIGRPLGRGKFGNRTLTLKCLSLTWSTGRVYLAREKTSKYIVAIKVQHRIV